MQNIDLLSLQEMTHFFGSTGGGGEGDARDQNPQGMQLWHKQSESL